VLGASAAPARATCRPDTRTLRLAAALFAAKVALHLALGARYGYNGDELYFIACGRHLAFLTESIRESRAARDINDARTGRRNDRVNDQNLC